LRTLYFRISELKISSDRLGKFPKVNVLIFVEKEANAGFGHIAVVGMGGKVLLFSVL